MLLSIRARPYVVDLPVFPALAAVEAAGPGIRDDHAQSLFALPLSDVELRAAQRTRPRSQMDDVCPRGSTRAVFCDRESEHLVETGLFNAMRIKSISASFM